MVNPPLLAAAPLPLSNQTAQGEPSISSGYLHDDLSVCVPARLLPDRLPHALAGEGQRAARFQGHLEPARVYKVEHLHQGGREGGGEEEEERFYNPFGGTGAY